MAANPQIVTTDTTITYDGVPQRLPRGTVVDVPNGSALATALSGNIAALATGQKNDNYGSLVGPSIQNRTGGGNEPYNAGQS